MRIETWTEIGTRTENQDRFYTAEKEKGILLAVADGHSRDGSMVAERAIKVMKHKGVPLLNNAEGWFEHLHRNVLLSTRIFIKGGSTLSAVYCFANGDSYVYQIGDSPVYIKVGNEALLFRGHGVDYPENSPDLDRALTKGGKIEITKTGAVYLRNGKGKECLKLTSALGDAKFGEILGRQPIITKIEGVVDAVLVASDGYNGTKQEFFNLTKRREGVDSFRKAQEGRGIHDNLTFCLAYLL